MPCQTKTVQIWNISLDELLSQGILMIRAKALPHVGVGPSYALFFTIRRYLARTRGGCMSRDVFYSIQQVAAALEVSKKTIRRRIQYGDLKAIEDCSRIWISQRGLRKWILRAIAIARPKRTYAKSKSDGINLEQNIGQSVSDTGYNSVDTPSMGSLKGKVSDPKLAAVEMLGTFRYFARKMAPKNPSLQDDLTQEMSLAVVSCNHAANRTFFTQRAKFAAFHYLERESLRGMAGLSEVKKKPVAVAPIRDDALLRLLAMADIPVSLIWRELGIAICPEVEADQYFSQKAGLGTSERSVNGARKRTRRKPATAVDDRRAHCGDHSRLEPQVSQKAYRAGRGRDFVKHDAAGKNNYAETTAVVA